MCQPLKKGKGNTECDVYTFQLAHPSFACPGSECVFLCFWGFFCVLDNGWTMVSKGSSLWEIHYPQEKLARSLSVAQEGWLAEPRDAREHVTAGCGGRLAHRAAGARGKTAESYSRLHLKLSVQRGWLNCRCLGLELPLLRAKGSAAFLCVGAFSPEPRRVVAPLWTSVLLRLFT